MKRFIKVISMILCLTMLLTLLLGNKAVGEVGPRCNKKKLYEYGDFIITEDNEIYDFSDSGLQKEYIIFPEKINGKELQIYIDKRIFVTGRINKCRYSENIKKIYFNLRNFGVEEYKVRECLSYSYRKNVMHKETYGNKEYSVGHDKHKVFFNDALRINVIDYINTSAVSKLEKDIYTTRRHIPAYTSTNLEERGFQIYVKLANIEFMYNYENAPNKGYYWIDDLETGETLTYIPKNPTREGYTFGGWYADSECSIEYDFETPYVKKDLLEGVYERQIKVYEGIEIQTEYYLYYPEDYVTYIYAKWIKN